MNSEKRDLPRKDIFARAVEAREKLIAYNRSALERLETELRATTTLEKKEDLEARIAILAKSLL